MKPFSPGNQVDMFEASESSSETLTALDEKIPQLPALVELDEDDQNSLNTDAWLLLNSLAEVRLNKVIRERVLKLAARFEEALGWYITN